MKLTLTVLNAGKSQGKLIAIAHPQFVIGRDPQCHLRPASALISKRHCAILVRGDKVFVRDFESTNGTFVNEEPVKGEQEVHNEDRLKAGPLEFLVTVEADAKPKPKRPAAVPPAQPSEDDSAAAMLLSLEEDDSGLTGATSVDEEGIPTGSTVMDALTPAGAEAAGQPDKAGPHKPQQNKTGTGDTSSAAKAILDKYIRRPRV